MAAESSFTAAANLIETESYLFLALPHLDRTCYLEKIIISKDLLTVEWGRMLFCYFLSGSENVNLTTF